MQDLLRDQDLPLGIEPPTRSASPSSQRRYSTTRRCCGSTRNISPCYCRYRHSSASGYWAAIGRSGPAAGLYFKREWCAVVDENPADLDVVRYWDLAATEKTQFNDPDWTVGIKLGRDRNGGYWLLDVVRRRANPGDVEKLLLDTATQDGK
jgi:hypothetical protein